MRKATLICCLYLMVVSLWCVKARASSVLIVDRGRGVAYIAVADDVSGQVKAAANDLARYVKMSTGAELVVHMDSAVSPGQGMARIVVKTSPKRPAPTPDRIEATDGFSINFPDAHTVNISGDTDWGTEFGVYEFLERYVGIRWLMPGPDGEHLPKLESLSVPMIEVRQKPAFFSRRMSGIKGQEQTLWAGRNRMHSQINFHHNLYKLFPPGKYKNTHPEFFSLISGKRFLPADGPKHKWQLCFSAPGIVEEAVKNICEFFAKYPKETSFSLGVNDGAGHCECAACRAKDSGQKNFLGFPDLSDRYFEWANAVAAGVLAKYPDKWFGCLAYREVAQPPTRVQIHPRIVPFMTYDRMKWVSDRFASEGHTMTERWREKSSSLGWYDYIYGTPYLVPRIYFHTMADYLRWGHDHGVGAIYAEAYPNWGEGPKLYLALKLYWNPDLNVDEALRDWFVAAVGADAAPYLAAYYDLWENFWTKRVPRSDWFNDTGQYLLFSRPDYLALVTAEDISKSRDLLTQVLTRTRTEKERKRAQLILRAFEYYEASAISYLGLVKKDYRGLVNKDPSYFQAMNKKRLQLVDEFELDPVLRHPMRPDKRGLLWGMENSAPGAKP